MSGNPRSHIMLLLGDSGLSVRITKQSSKNMNRLLVSPSSPVFHLHPKDLHLEKKKVKNWFTLDQSSRRSAIQL